MNDELITRLRAADAWNDLETHMDSLCAEAADALEAAQAEAEENRIRKQIIETAYKQIKGLEAERDAEAALADSLAEALGTERDVHQCNSAFTADALAAHRERRTKGDG